MDHLKVKLNQTPTSKHQIFNHKKKFSGTITVSFIRTISSKCFLIEVVFSHLTFKKYVNQSHSSEINLNVFSKPNRTCFLSLLAKCPKKIPSFRYLFGGKQKRSHSSLLSTILSTSRVPGLVTEVLQGFVANEFL